MIEEGGFVSEKAIDSFDLIPVKDESYEKLKDSLLITQERTSKLLQMLKEKGLTCFVSI